MIRRLIITLLVVSILGYGMSVVADMHYGESPADQIVTLVDSDDSADDSHNLTIHNHCSHGTFHLSGLSFAPAKPMLYGAYTPKSAYLATWVSFLDSPPSRPPKA